MMTTYKRGNKFERHMSLADAAVDWEGVTPAEYELIVIGEDGLPYMPDRPELRERAEAILTAVERRKISGMVNDMYGEDLHPRYIRLDRDSVAVWIKETDAWLAEKEAEAVAVPSSQLNLPMQQPTDDRRITSAEVKTMLGISKATLTRRMNELPPATKEGNENRWSRNAILKYMAEQEAASEAERLVKAAAKQAEEKENQARREEANIRKKQGDSAIMSITKATLKK